MFFRGVPGNVTMGCSFKGQMLNDGLKEPKEKVLELYKNSTRIRLIGPNCFVT